MGKSVLYVDMNVKLKSLKNEEAEVQQTLGQIIADAISVCGSEQCKTLKPTKLIGWAEKLAMNEPLSLDDTDFELLREFIGLLPRLNILVIVQADRCFKAAKEASKAEKGE